MRRRILSFLAIVALLTAAITAVAAPTFAHDFDANCAGVASSTGLLYVYQDNPAGGDEENACYPSDSNWGCCAGTSSIQDFNDKMSWFHLTDRAGDGLKFCVRFYDTSGLSGVSKLANGGDSVGNGLHKSLAAPSGWNDRVSSHEQYGVGGASC